ncbi:small acid-soluble spore protein SspI [Paenibacillus abyssi]|uniref:Small, acid-soluble spore protein I n=1 Tax=Paenibacillus abyssi TaxID=1340531 RepID=A0A917G5G7_9BACL|nr:small acid-soluble spore protein SspI [Paenibacillus abyssi]GGG23835.1 small, acid-soluble spore protein I [Paenibacillus abyssi]
MNNLDLRQAIIQRVQGKTDEDLTDVIESSIGNDERTLPGLGVLFEMIWQESDKAAQTTMVSALHNSLQKKTTV